MNWTEGVDDVASVIDAGAGVSGLTAGASVVAASGTHVCADADYAGARADLCVGAGCTRMRAVVSVTGAGDNAATDPDLVMRA